MNTLSREAQNAVRRVAAKHPGVCTLSRRPHGEGRVTGPHVAAAGHSAHLAELSAPRAARAPSSR